jgi:hypothetical protein
LLFIKKKFFYKKVRKNFLIRLFYINTFEKSINAYIYCIRA